MRKFFKVLITVIVICILCICMSMAIITGINMERRDHPNVKSGQVWVRNAKDPFKPKSDTIYILEVNGDYSRYKMKGIEDSDRNMWVVWNAKLIKDVK